MASAPVSPSAVEHAVEFFGGVHFDQHIEREAVGDCGEVLDLGIGERGGDEQNGVGTVGAGFDDLVLVDDEVLAQARQAYGAEASSRLRRLP